MYLLCCAVQSDSNFEDEIHKVHSSQSFLVTSLPLHSKQESLLGILTSHSDPPQPLGFTNVSMILCLYEPA